MFDFSISELAVFGVVTLLAIGPKDMPVAMRWAARTVKKARKMAGEFQGHLDEMMREADLSEVSEHLRDIRNFDVRRQVMRAIDPERVIEKSVSEVNVAMRPEPVITRPDESDPPAWEAPRMPEPVAAPTPAPEPAVIEDLPAFIPPSCARKPAPAFIPPSSARRGF